MRIVQIPIIAAPHPTRVKKLIVCVAFLSALAWADGGSPCPAKVTHLTVKDGSYSPVPGATFGLRDFDADMVSRGPASPLCYQRTTKIVRGEVFVSAESLTKMFTQKVKQSKQSQISDIKVGIGDDGTAKISGQMHRKIDVPFEIQGPVTTDGTNLILQAKKIKAEKIEVKGLLGMMGKNLGEMLGSQSVNGVKANGDTLIFQPSQISHAEGHITNFHVTSKGLEITFGPAEEKSAKAKKK